MVVGERVTDNHLRPLLPVGTVLNDENLHQMLAHQVEFVCVSEPDERSPQQVASDAAAAAQRIDAVFANADRTAPHIAALCEQLLQYRCA